MKFRVLALVALLLGSPWAVAKKYDPPSPIAEQLPVEVMFAQQEIAIDTPDNSVISSQFGLIGALVGAAISNAQAKTAEERAAEVRNLLIEHRFNDRFEAAIRSRIAAQGISPMPRITVRDTPWDAYSANTQAGLRQASNAGNTPPTGVLMSISPRYALSYTLHEAYVRMNVSLMQRTLKPNGKYKEKWLWYRSYTFRFPLDAAPGAKPEDNIVRWKEIGGPGLARMLDIGVEQVADMLAYDFSTEGRLEAARKISKEYGEFNGQKTVGRQLRSTADWYWLRSGKGYMMTLTGVMPVRPGLAASTVEAGEGSAKALETEAPAMQAQETQVQETQADPPPSPEAVPPTTADAVPAEEQGP